MLGREPDKHGLFVEKASGEKVGPHRIFAWWGPKRLIDLPGQALFLRKAAGATFPEQHPCQFPRDGTSLAGRRSDEDQRQPYGVRDRLVMVAIPAEMRQNINEKLQLIDDM